MSYLTFERLEKQTSSSFSDQPLENAFSLNESFGKASLGEKQIFLSYRRKDIKYVKPVVKFLKSLGIPVYIDYLDTRSAAFAMLRYNYFEKCIFLTGHEVE
jgi:hypothetical protein